MTAEIAAVASPPSAAASAGPTASQNLFEHLAARSQGLPEGASPSQLGNNLIENLQGFIDRTGSFSSRAQDLSARVPESASSELVSLGSSGLGVGTPPAAMGARPSVEQGQVDQAIESLSLMFDHAIETQLVVRGSTQVSGAANTLIRGQ